MSDFDAEAERKRLREKYEAEEERRKETQQMSELLLKGATMTNRHCGECGSPIFRYQDQEFCPSCQQVMGGADGGGANATETSSGASGRPGETPGAADGVDAAEAGGTGAADESTATPDATPDADPSATAEGDPASNGVDPTVTPDVSEQRQQSGNAPSNEATSGNSASNEAASEAADGLDRSATPAERDAPERPESTTATRQTARESLLEALTRHARLAARTDEPRRAAEHLSAANEAAAALDALDG